MITAPPALPSLYHHPLRYITRLSPLPSNAVRAITNLLSLLFSRSGLLAEQGHPLLFQSLLLHLIRHDDRNVYPPLSNLEHEHPDEENRNERIRRAEYTQMRRPRFEIHRRSGEERSGVLSSFVAQRSRITLCEHGLQSSIEIGRAEGTGSDRFVERVPVRRLVNLLNENREGETCLAMSRMEGTVMAR